MQTRCLFAAVFALTSGSLTGPRSQAADDLKASAVLATMEQVAAWQLANPNLKHDPTDWTQATLYNGMMALGDLSPDPRWRAAMLEVGRQNGWKLGERVYHADDHAVGQMYAEMFALYRDPAMLAPMRERFDWLLANPDSRPVGPAFQARKNKAEPMRWWWCDALFMGPPTLARLYAATGEKKYLDLLLQEWNVTSEFLYDKEEQLFFRDGSYFKKREANGKKIFWSRGNGWVMGGLVRVLQVLPADHPQRARFETQFREMAAALLKCQQPDGLWRASLLDPASYPLKETSGSGFYTYALAWGINQGLLDRATYEPAARKGWNALVACVNADGKLTHVQPIGADPKKFDSDKTEVYGVGAFLLAGSEMYRLLLLSEFAHKTITVANDLDQFRPQETIEIDAKLGNAVMDGVAGRWLTTQVLDGKLLFQSDFLPKQKKTFIVFSGVDTAKLPAPVLRTFARFVPERADDFTWESDRIAFRMYGPALEKKDGDKTGSGVDVWCKHVREPIINSMYLRDKLDKKHNYHNDDGKGADNYRVGPNRGCGGAAIWADGKLAASRCFTTWKLIAEGPIRTEFELTYAPWKLNGQEIAETRRVSLDLGSNLNRFEVRFGAVNVTAAAGLFIHGAASQLAHGENWASLWEPFSEGDGPGFIPVGLVWPMASGGQFKQADGHALVLVELKSAEPFVYYAGAGWSKGPDFPDATAWNAYLKSFAARLAAPLRVELAR